MSAPKHTPGPWAVLGENLSGEIEVVAPNRETVCVVLADEGRAETDARLIAAAPDLYEALTDRIELLDYVRAVLSYCDGNDPEAMSAASAVDILREAFDNDVERQRKARAAIAKAEGRE